MNPDLAEHLAQAFGLDSAADVDTLIATLRAGMREWFVPGSDPGLCVTPAVPEAVVAFGRRCQRDLVAQSEARNLAADSAMSTSSGTGRHDSSVAR